jgi:hypothetical protein
MDLYNTGLNFMLKLYIPNDKDPKVFWNQILILKKEKGLGM